LRFARFVYLAAGIWGIFITLPLYFLSDFISTRSPPAINHVEFYYGFVGVTLAWQIAFLLIAKEPHRLRLMMLPSIFEKASYSMSILVLLLQHQISVSQSVLAVTDSIWAVLFIASFVVTGAESARHQLA
jgi:hypothetical protein